MAHNRRDTKAEAEGYKGISNLPRLLWEADDASEAVEKWRAAQGGEDRGGD